MQELKDNYFLENSLLKENFVKVNKSKETLVGGPLEYVKKYNEAFTAIASCMNKLVICKFENGNFIYASSNDTITEKFLLELRMFNEEKELRFYKHGNKWELVIIEDEKTDANNDDGITVFSSVDSSSVIFGDKKEIIADEFTKLYEEGRKIYLTVPGIGFSKYQLRTRSYITYSEITGQAGFGFYRFVAIEGVDGNNG